MLNEHKKKSGFLHSLQPSSAFWLGLVAGIAAMFVVGFFILLGYIVKGGDLPVGNDRVANQPIAAAPNGNQPADITLQPITKDDWIKGDVNAPISIVEFSDLECPYCKRFHDTLTQVLADNPQVNLVYRHFPLSSLHSKAPKEAEAAECAGELGGDAGFWKFVDRLFAITPSNNGLDLDQLPEIASYAGLDKNAFNDCLDSGKYADKVQDHYQQAVAAGGQGTPYSVIVSGDQKVPVSGSVSATQLQSIIDSLSK